MDFHSFRYRLFAAASAGLIAALFAVGVEKVIRAGDEKFSTVAKVSLDEGFANPPAESRIHAYWWWLNGNVTPEAITRDLQGMHDLGWAGALVCDADGSNQFGNRGVQNGPLYGSPEWRKLLLHTVKEAERLGLELTVGIQSGWNLGGPNVMPETASKHIVWSEATIDGGSEKSLALAKPKCDSRFYRDIAVLALPVKQKTIDAPDAVASASSEQKDFPAALAFDGNPETFWVSAGNEPGGGPTAEKPIALDFRFAKPVKLSRITVLGRVGYGPKDCELQSAEADGTFSTVKKFSLKDGQTATVDFAPTEAKAFRLVSTSAFDVKSPDRPRNVQIAEVSFQSADCSWPSKQLLRKPIRDLVEKSGFKELAWSCPVTWSMLTDNPAQPDEEDARVADVVDVSKFMDDKGELKWSAPAGKWRIMRFGYSLTGARVSTCSKGWDGLVIDYLDPDALAKYWKEVADPILSEIRPWCGKTVKYIQTDSWEAGGMNWSPKFREEFKKRRGYDPLVFLPVVAGCILDDRDASNRFLNDLRKTIGDCVADNHYAFFAELARKYDLGIHPESGGPHGAPIDALKCLSRGDFPMMEFWCRANTHRVSEEDRFFVKQGASAAHIYGKKIVSAEGFTNVGLHWEESLGNNLKPTFDQAAVEGFNSLYWHAFTCSPDETGIPGQEYFAGTHCNPKSPWFKYSGGFVQYMNRCQYMLRQGLFVADVCYYYGDHVPNFAQLQKSDPARVLPQYDYDVTNEEVLLSRMQTRDGRIALPDGMSYRALILPTQRIISPAALKKIAELVRDGASVIGPKPAANDTLTNYPAADAEMKKLADEMWGAADGEATIENTYGKGRVFWTKDTKKVLAKLGVAPDFEFQTSVKDASVKFIHRTVGDAEVYFVANLSDRPFNAQCTFRVSDKEPELWSAESGAIRSLGLYAAAKDGRTLVPMCFEPYGSAFVVFRKPSAKHFVELNQGGKKLFPAEPSDRVPEFSPIAVYVGPKGSFNVECPAGGKFELKSDTGKTESIEIAAAKTHPIDGAWNVSFASLLDAPASTVFESLKSWTDNENADIKYFSGVGTYVREIDVTAEMLDEKSRLELDLGELREVGEVILNGKSLGNVWRAPYKVDITAAAKLGKNKLEVKVANHWANRVIGDQKLPPEKRKTKTNITKYDRGDKQPLPAGLLGPAVLRNVPIGSL